MIDFKDVVEKGEAIVPQMEAYAEKHDIELERGWKVEIAKLAKKRLLHVPEKIPTNVEEVRSWIQLFEQFQGNEG